MRPFDLNIHLPLHGEDTDALLMDEQQLGGPELLKCFRKHRPAIERACAGGNFMLFNPELTAEELAPFVGAVREAIPAARFTLLGAFRDPSASERLERLAGCGIDAVKFHCYVQRIEREHFDTARTYAQAAADLGMPLFVDTSYGTAGMYRYDNLRLAAHLLERIDSVPLVLLHSGGARVLEAMLLADACPNVFLETSFSLDCYAGSSIEQDQAFVYRKLGSHRIAYGSDFPYVSFEDARGGIERFLRRHGFEGEDSRNIQSHTAERIFDWNAC